jgi:peptide deformylase
MNNKEIDISKYSLVEDSLKLKIKTEKVSSIEEGEEIAAILFKILSKQKSAIGLTANQIGINKSVFVVNVLEPLYFINPEVLETSYDEIPYIETCLSIPNKKARTIRKLKILIKADNLSKPQWFGSDKKPETFREIFYDDKILECVAIQHEFDHTIGVLITDRDTTKKPIKIKKKIGRNDIVRLQKNNEIVEIKYKNINKYLNNGYSLI